MDKKKVAAILEEIGVMLELKGENPFKTRAYFNGARIIETQVADLAAVVESGEIDNIKGIGQALSEKITTLVQTGSLPYYEELKNQTPPGLLEMLEIQGLGAKKIKTIHEQLKISTIGELEYACRENRLRDLPGFGQKSQDKILQGIEWRKKYSERFLFHIALDEAGKLLEYLRQNKKIKRMELAGSLRRKKETIKDIDILASCADADREELMKYFTTCPGVQNITGQGNTKSSVVLESGINADFRLVTDEEFPFALHHFTGSKEHNTAMRALAKKSGLKMSEYGLFDGEERIDCGDETEIFKKMSMPFIAPELRENQGEIEAALNNSLPELYSGDPFYGIFHAHSTWSDGAFSIKEMADACRQMGLQYLGITDHSKSAFYANGLNEERVRQQMEEIDRINQNYDDFVIFKGIEADILADGSLDYEDDILAGFDFVIASVHSIFGLTPEKMTERICRAAAHPLVTMIGHPTGRLLLGREAYAVQMEKVIETAAKHNTVIEINASPYRLDLDWRLGKLANELHVKTALNPDAHSIEGLRDYVYGIGIARKGWFTKEAVLNSYPADQVTQFFKKRR